MRWRGQGHPAKSHRWGHYGTAENFLQPIPVSPAARNSYDRGHQRGVVEPHDEGQEKSEPGQVQCPHLSAKGQQVKVVRWHGPYLSGLSRSDPNRYFNSHANHRKIVQSNDLTGKFCFIGEFAGGGREEI